MCDMDCLTCPFCRAGNTRYFDASLEDEDGNAETFMESFYSDNPSAEDIICELDLLKALYAELRNLAPNDYEVCSTIMKNMSERKAAEELGLPRNTYTYRKKKVLDQLKKALKKFL